MFNYIVLRVKFEMMFSERFDKESAKKVFM